MSFFSIAGLAIMLLELFILSRVFDSQI